MCWGKKSSCLHHHEIKILVILQLKVHRVKLGINACNPNTRSSLSSAWAIAVLWGEQVHGTEGIPPKMWYQHWGLPQQEQDTHNLDCWESHWPTELRIWPSYVCSYHWLANIPLDLVNSQVLGVVSYKLVQHTSRSHCFPCGCSKDGIQGLTQIWPMLYHWAVSSALDNSVLTVSDT